MLGQLIERSEETACHNGYLDELGYDGIAIAINLSYYLSNHTLL